MYAWSGVRRILAHREPVDMRKSFDGLIAIVRHVLGEDPLSGTLFVFVNRKRTGIAPGSVCLRSVSSGVASRFPGVHTPKSSAIKRFASFSTGSHLAHEVRWGRSNA